MMYTQCFLRNGAQETVAWIKTKFAKIGHVLRMKDINGIWEDGWNILFVGDSTKQDNIPDFRIVHQSFKCPSGSFIFEHKLSDSST